MRGLEKQIEKKPLIKYLSFTLQIRVFLHLMDLTWQLVNECVVFKYRLEGSLRQLCLRRPLIGKRKRHLRHSRNTQFVCVGIISINNGTRANKERETISFAKTITKVCCSNRLITNKREMLGVVQKQLKNWYGGEKFCEAIKPITESAAISEE